MRWPEIAKVLKSRVVMLPVGSAEQHRRHFPFNIYSLCFIDLTEQSPVTPVPYQRIAQIRIVDC
jgi:hypothetical protein